MIRRRLRSTARTSTASSLGACSSSLKQWRFSTPVFWRYSMPVTTRSSQLYCKSGELCFPFTKSSCSNSGLHRSDSDNNPHRTIFLMERQGSGDYLESFWIHMYGEPEGSTTHNTLPIYAEWGEQNDEDRWRTRSLADMLHLNVIISLVYFGVQSDFCYRRTQFSPMTIDCHTVLLICTLPCLHETCNFLWEQIQRELSLIEC